MTTGDDIDRTLEELLATGDVVRRWDEARGWVYHARSAGPSAPPAEDPPRLDFAAFMYRLNKARRQLGKARRYLRPNLLGEHAAVLLSIQDLADLATEFATDEEIMVAGLPVEESEARAERECRVCGCNENKPCMGVASDQADAPSTTEVGCVWVAPDLCSACVVNWARDPIDDPEPTEATE